MRSRLWSVLASTVVAGWLTAPADAQPSIFGLAGEESFEGSFMAKPRPIDGAVATAVALGARDIAVAPDGSLVVAAGDVWRIGLDGRLTRVAGTGRAGFSGDGGPATRARTAASSI